MSAESAPDVEHRRMRRVRRKRRHRSRSWWARWRDRARRWVNSGRGFFVLLLLVIIAVVALFLIAGRWP